MPTRNWGSEQLVGTSTAGEQFNTQVASLANGGYVVAWQDNGGANSIIRAQSYDAMGNPAGNEVSISAQGVDYINPSVAGLADGSFYLTCTQRVVGVNYIIGQVYDANGVSIRSQPVVFASGLADDSDVSAYVNGSIVSWTDPIGSDIRYRYFDAAGNGSEILTANAGRTGLQSNSSVATFGENAAFSFHSDVDGTSLDNDGIMVRLFTPSGFNTEQKFVLAGAFPVALGNSDIAWLNATDFVVVADYESIPGLSLSAQVFRVLNLVATPSLVAASGQIQVNTSQVGFGALFGKPQVAALPTGGFAVVWVTNSSFAGDSDGSIYLQAFDAGWNKIGGEVLVNTTTSGIQDLPSIAVLGDGRVVVSWTDASSDAGDIRTQIIDPRDGLVNGTINADTLYGNDIVNDQITGYDGADRLFGLGGADGLYGGAGNDLAIGGRGDDVAYGGADADTLRGNNGDDVLFGQDGNDTLQGGNGDDELSGGANNDVLSGGAGADILDGGINVDRADYGTATAGVTVALDNSLVFTGEALGDSFIAIENLAGSNFADRLRGNSLANGLSGREGDDRLEGRGGADTLTGNEGSDIFAYASITESGPTARDQITDFTVIAGDGTTFADRIDLSAIDAITGGGTANDAFTFIGTAAFTAAGQVRVTASGLSDTLVEINTAGTSGAEMAIILKAILPAAIFNEDFIL